MLILLALKIHFQCTVKSNELLITTLQYSLNFPLGNNIIEKLIINHTNFNNKNNGIWNRVGLSTHIQMSSPAQKIHE